MLEVNALIRDENKGLLTSSDKKRDSVRIDCDSVRVSIERRIQRTVIRGGEGDDLLDEGSESAVYDIVSSASVSTVSVSWMISAVSSDGSLSCVQEKLNKKKKTKRAKRS